MVELRLSGVIKESIVDGNGIRFVVFAQGCKHNCPECHNPQTHSFDGGYISNSDNLIAEIKKNPMLQGVTFSGGDPFEQAYGFSEFGREIHSLGLNVYSYTGYTVEYLLKNMNEQNGWKELLMQTDVLIDGPYIKEKRDLLAKFKGSTNQRYLDAKKCVLENKAVEIEI